MTTFGSKLKPRLGFGIKVTRADGTVEEVPMKYSDELTPSQLKRILNWFMKMRKQNVSN